jgi:hypothetical protein
MKFYTTIFFTVFFLFGCGLDLHKPPSQKNLDLIYDNIPVYDETKTHSFYESGKFLDLIEHSKLQLFLKDTSIEYTDLIDFKSPEFYVDEEDNLNFTVYKEYNTSKVRSEIKEWPKSLEWSTADTKVHSWVATLKCLKPKVGISSYTWMQIHGNFETYNYPVLRMIWQRNKDGIYNHLWAMVIVSNPHSQRIYEYVDLGEKPDGFFTAQVDVKDNIMKIMINNNLIKVYNIKYWQEVQNYYKAGVYIDRFGDGGSVSVIFEKLDFF